MEVISPVMASQAAGLDNMILNFANNLNPKVAKI